MFFSSSPISEKLEGAILAHSISAGTKRFKKGRVLSLEDIKVLSAAQIDDVMVAILDNSDIGEDLAAKKIAELVAGDGLTMSAPFTGRVNLFASANGVCKIDVEKLQTLNRLNEAITVASIPDFEMVQPKQMVATIKIIPFSVPNEIMEKVIGLLDKPLVKVQPFQVKKTSLIQTHYDATKPSVLDKTKTVLNNRLSALSNRINKEIRCPHKTAKLADQIRLIMATDRPDLLILTGASAITDRADVLPAALELAGGNIQRFGMPVDPGNLLMLGDISGTRVIGMPGCARSPKLNGFDWVLQRLMANINISNDDISDMAVGGLLKEISTRPSPRASLARTPTMAKKPSVTAIVLAAGQSRRMGKDNKLLKKINGIPMIRHTVDIVQRCHMDEIIVVTGHEAKAIEVALSGTSTSFKHNELFDEGISSSLKAGISAVPLSSDAVLICLGDMPLISSDDIHSLTAAFSPADGRSICVPTYKGKWGNPVLLGKQFFSEIQDLTGDIGARHLISEYPDLVCEVEMSSDGVLSDFDNPESFKRFD